MDLLDSRWHPQGIDKEKIFRDRRILFASRFKTCAGAVCRVGSKHRMYVRTRQADLRGKGRAPARVFSTPSAGSRLPGFRRLLPGLPCPLIFGVSLPNHLRWGMGTARGHVDAFSLDPWNLFAINIRNITLKPDTAPMWLDTAVEAPELFTEIKLILCEHVEQSGMLASRSHCPVAECSPFRLSLPLLPVCKRDGEWMGDLQGLPCPALCVSTPAGQ